MGRLSGSVDEARLLDDGCDGTFRAALLAPRHGDEHEDAGKENEREPGEITLSYSASLHSGR
jgi:hypothetical protein